MPHTCAISTNSGLPGGCGMPSTLAADMYSDVSQNWVVGATVRAYSANTAAATAAAMPYGGRSELRGGAVMRLVEYETRSLDRCQRRARFSSMRRFCIALATV